MSQAMSLEQKKDFVVQVFVSSTTPICPHLGRWQMQGGFLRNQWAITGVYYINPAAFTWASTILIAEAVFLPAPEAGCKHMQFSTASLMHVYNKASHPVQAVAHRKYLVQNLRAEYQPHQLPAAPSSEKCL